MKNFYGFMANHFPPRTRDLLEDARGDTITPTDIFDFYFLSAQYLTSDIDVRNWNLREFYLQELKDLYLRVFSSVLIEQIQKYYKPISRPDIIKNAQSRAQDPKFGRVQTSGNKGNVPLYGPEIIKSLPSMPVAQRFETILEIMKETLRSDMQRPNDVWNQAARFALGLAKSHSAQDIVEYINYLNMQVHNTHTKILGDKVPNGRALIKAFDICHKYSPDRWSEVWGGPTISREVQKIKGTTNTSSLLRHS
jgi:hypothetical protein